MSLWYESLMGCLQGCGHDVEKKATCIVTYLSMPVPRSWWEQAMESGTLSDNYISILSNSLAELSQVARLKGQLSYGLLIALAFTNDNAKEWSFGKDAGRDGSMDEILSKAKQVLIERPELMRLANLINAATKQAPSKENIL